MAKKITQFDIPTLKRLDPELNEALAKVGKRHGISIEMDSGGRYDSKTANLKIKLALLNEDGSTFDKEREDFIHHVERMKKFNVVSDISADWLDKSFVERGRTFTVTGMKPGNKFNIVTRRDDGKTYFWTSRLVDEAFKRITPANAAA